MKDVSAPKQERKKTRSESWVDESRGRSLRMMFRSLQPALQWGAALATVAVFVLVGWLIFENSRLRNEMTQTRMRRDVLSAREQQLQSELEAQRTKSAATEQDLTRIREERQHLEQQLQELQQSSVAGAKIASFVLRPQVRGVAQVRTISLPTQTERVSMRLELDENRHTTYQVALIEPSTNRVLWQSGRIKSSADRALRVSVPAKLLNPQAYLLRVSSSSSSGPSETVGDYAFRVAR